MNQSMLRFKGWLSAFRPFALGIGLLGMFIFRGGLNKYNLASRAVYSPQVEIGQLLRGEFEPGSYVTISGLLLFGGIIEETENDMVAAVYNPLIDLDTGDMIVVRFTQREMFRKEGEEMIRVSGILASPDSELNQLIRDVMPDAESVGLITTADLYVDIILVPGQVDRLKTQMVGLSMLLIFGALFVAMPPIIFAPEPMTARPLTAGSGSARVQVTGMIYKLYPRGVSLEPAKHRRHFSKAQAYVVRDEPCGLSVHVHQVVTHRYMGIQTGRTESDWRVRIAPHQVMCIESGKLYTFDQRWALRIKYRDHLDKDAVLVLSFESDQHQATFVSMLKEMGFAVSWLGYASPI